MNERKKPAGTSRTITRPEMLAQLEREYNTLGSAIEIMRRLVNGNGPRRGRPPGSKNKAA